jgi:hypothetical protein
MLDWLFENQTQQIIPPAMAVPPVPSRKKQREPLQPTNGAAVPSVPPVPSKKTKSKTETNITNAEQIARAYCASIGETDDAIINDVINQCRHSAEALAYYAAQVDRSSAGSLHSVRALAGGLGAGGGLVDAHQAGGIITCQTCGHWQAFSLHGRGPGVCSAGVQGTGVCRWGSTEHRCSMYGAR